MLSTVVTLGPASERPEVLDALLGVADRFRLNGSHLDLASLDRWLARLDRLFDRAGRRVPVVLDLQGAKMRIGRIVARAALPERVVLRPQRESDEPAVPPVPHPPLFRAAAPGDLLSLDDGRVRLRVIDAGEDLIEAEVLETGPLSSFKGINREEHPIPFEGVLERDRLFIEATRDREGMEYAFSFVHSGEEAAALRAIAPGRRLAAKVERVEAMACLDWIAAAFDEVWLCRGDLGAQAGLARLGALQAAFVAAFPAMACPRYLAGQVLEHLTHHPEPTRSEVVHLHDAEAAGFTGFVLSDETAIGKDPVSVARYLRTLRA